MRTFILSTVLSFGGLAGGSLLPAQDPPTAPKPAAELTPAEVELILHYVELRTLETKPHDQAIQEIWLRYDALIRQALPPEKYFAAKAYLGGC